LLDWFGEVKDMGGDAEVISGSRVWIRRCCAHRRSRGSDPCLERSPV